jgi:hypothetical protein
MGAQDRVPVHPFGQWSRRVRENGRAHYGKVRLMAAENQPIRTADTVLERPSWQRASRVDANLAYAIILNFAWSEIRMTVDPGVGWEGRGSGCRQRDEGPLPRP